MSERYDLVCSDFNPARAERLRAMLRQEVGDVSLFEHALADETNAATIDFEPHAKTAGTSIPTRIADQGPETETEIIMLTEADTPTPTPTPNRRWLLLAAAAVVVLVVAGIALAGNTDDDSTPSPTAVATVAPTTTVPTRTETVSFAVTPASIPVTFTVPFEWTFDEALATTSKGNGIGEVGLNFHEIPNIYADGCQWTPLDPPVGPTVDDLVAAWANLPEFAATGAVDVTVDGYAGKQIEFTVPDYNIGACKGADYPMFGLWTAPDNAAYPGWVAQGPNQHNQQRILDVDGTRLVITAYYVPSASPQDLAALEQAVASIQIG